MELTGFHLAERIVVRPVRSAQCRIATFCHDQQYTLLHSSAGYEPFERHLGLTVARP